MARFRFELETVLEVRRREERERMRAVADLERHRLDLEDSIRSRREAMEASKRDLRDALAPGGAVDLTSVRLQTGASLGLSTQTHRLAIELAGVLKRLESARAVLLEATRRRKAVESLKAKRYEQWKREQDRREAAEQDDLSTTRHTRRKIREASLH